MTDTRAFEFGGIRIDNLTQAEAVTRILALAQEKQAHYVVTPNADHMIHLQKDTDFQAAYHHASLTVADGMPLIWASKILGNPLKERVSGADLLPALCEQAALNGQSIWLLGAPPGVAKLAAEKLTARYVGLQVAGTYCPPMGFEKDTEECERILLKINACQPDLVFVGVGSPKQELWIARYRDRLHCGVLLGIGAAIEFAAGTVNRAPVFMQKAGLEWLHRLATNPGRLAGRYFRDLAFFRLLFNAWRQQR